jgi:hypothetical protein
MAALSVAAWTINGRDSTLANSFSPQNPEIDTKPKSAIINVHETIGTHGILRVHCSCFYARVARAKWSPQQRR